MSLATYLHAYLGGLASQLGFSVESGSYDFIVTETLTAYGVDTEDQATDKHKLYALAKYELWSAILREISFDYDFSADGVSNKRSQLFDHVNQMRSDTLIDTYQYLPDYQIEVESIDTFDPYKR